MTMRATKSAVNSVSAVSPFRLPMNVTCLNLDKFHIGVSKKVPLQKLLSHRFSTSLPRLLCNASVLNQELATKEKDPKLVSLEPLSQPVGALNNLNQILKVRLGLETMFTHRFKVTSEGFHCSLTIKWPQEEIFCGTAQKKKVALAQASAQALRWLIENNHISKKGRPVISNDKNTYVVCLQEEELANIDNVLKRYHQEVVPALGSYSAETIDPSHEDSEKNNLIHPLLNIPMPSSKDLESWSISLKEKYKPPSISDLPVESYRDAIIKIIKENRVTIIKGETGCGKSTKIPQFILDDSIKEGNGAFCNIVVSQPRRITAVELAKRVADERNEKLGNTIGYAVKLDTKFPHTVGGAIMFFTAGKLGLTFISNPTLTGISHVVLDEAHIRDTPTDMLMTLLKIVLKQNENLKLIIMSATINNELIKSYYDCIGGVATIEIPGRMFPVKSYFLDDFPDIVASKQTRFQFKAEMDISLAVAVINWLHSSKPAGTILGFVSGWNHMLEIKELLSANEDLQVVLIHGMIRDNSSAFAPPFPGKRKVILATNVAETSLTFPDVVYVVDCGVHKVQKRDLNESIGWSTSKRLLTWISKANVKQRIGRAGRVQAGESFHLFSRKEFDRMRDFEPPRIYSDHLENVILNMKMIFPNQRAVDLLSQFLSPPHSGGVTTAVESLKNAGLISLEDEQPTSLAKIATQISASLPSAIFLIHGAVFRCLHIVSSIVACVESQMTISSNDRPHCRNLKLMYHESSDHLANGTALLKSSDKLKSSESFENASYIRSRLLKQILSIIHAKKKFIGGDINVNENNQEELIKGIFLHSPCSLLTLKYNKELKSDLCTENGLVASFRSDSVNYPLSEKSQFFLCLKGHTVGKVFLVNEATAVSALSILLFFKRKFSTTENKGFVEIKVCNTPLKIIIPSEHYARITDLQVAIKITIDYFVSTEISGKCGPLDGLMNSFRRELSDCLIQILDGNKNNKANDLTHSK